MFTLVFLCCNTLFDKLQETSLDIILKNTTETEAVEITVLFTGKDQVKLVNF